MHGSRRTSWIMAVVAPLGACAVAAPTSAQDEWPTLARGPGRVALTPTAPQSLAQPAWIFEDTPQGPFTPIGLSGVVTGDGLVFALGSIDGQSVAVAIEQMTGELAWASPAPEPFFDSWSTPTYDAATGALYIGSGTELVALRASDGEELWSAQLDGDIVNATCLVTSDLGPADRAFITDSSGFGGGARLYCINIDPFHMTLNPHEPGAIVWTFKLGQASGSTPAYGDGVVYIATAGDSAGRPPGILFALPAGVSASPAPLWATPNPAPEGFYGGLCLDKSGAQPVLYAASYAFYGGLFSGNLVKVRAADGAVVWSTPCNRTASIPVPLGDGRIALSAGLRGFGTVPSLQLFRDEGASARVLWDSAVWTWDDIDGDGALDPGEFEEMGGWTHQPAVATVGSRRVLIAGTIPSGGFFEPYERLRIFDLRFAPGETSFTIGEAPAGGSSPAVDAGALFSIGPEGVVGYLPSSSPCWADCDGSGSLNLFDMLCFQGRYIAGDPRADCDGSGAIDFFDFLCFLVLYAQGCH